MVSRDDNDYDLDFRSSIDCGLEMNVPGGFQPNDTGAGYVLVEQDTGCN
jgi:hypothetical protein